MLYHAILNLTHPANANAKKAKIAEEIAMAAKAVFARGMAIPDDKEKLEQEQEMWTRKWDRCLVHGVVTWIVDKLTGLQGTLEVILLKARDHGVEPWVAGHIITKMEEVHLMCTQWKEEVVAWHEAEA